jgi:hypothetical protein
MPTLLAPPPLERVLQQFHDSEINAGVQTFYDAGMRVWIGDEANGIQAETTINWTGNFADPRKWPEGFTAASWLHETALRLMMRLASFASCKCGRGPSDSKHCDPFPRGLPVRQRRWQPKL